MPKNHSNSVDIDTSSETAPLLPQPPKQSFFTQLKNFSKSAITGIQHLFYETADNSIEIKRAGTTIVAKKNSA
jgi:hypothetical protein